MKKILDKKSSNAVQPMREQWLSVSSQNLPKYVLCDIHLRKRTFANTCTSMFLISLYGTPLSQRDSYLIQHSSLFGPDDTIKYDYNVTNI